jgi:hypothetical protein
VGKISNDTSNIEEVGWGSAVKRDDVHGRHGETSAVDQTTNVSVKADVVKVGLGRDDFSLVFLLPVSELEDFLLSVSSVLVEVDLGVHGENFAGGVFGERVNFEKRAILKKTFFEGSLIICFVNTFSLKSLYIFMK